MAIHGTGELCREGWQPLRKRLRVSWLRIGCLETFGCHLPLGQGTDVGQMLDRGKAEPLGPLWDTPLMNLPGFNNDKQNHSNNNWVGITYIILLFASLCPKFAETHNIHQAPSCHHRCVWWEAPTVASAASIPAAETSSTSPTAIPTWGKPWRPTMGRQVFLGPVGEVGGIDQGLQPERIMNDSF